MTISRGWKEREASAKAKLAARAAGYNLACTEKEQARHALREAQAAEARAHQEERERAYRETVAVCPCCTGKGHVIVITGAAWMEAFERYSRVDWKPSVETIGLMMRSAFEVDRCGNRVTAETAPAPAAPPAPAAEPVKPSKAPRKPAPPAPPWLDEGAVLEGD